MRNGNARDTVSNRQEIFSSSENYASSDAAPDDAVPPPVSPEDVDELLSKELQELSFQERSNILEEVHGVTCFAPNETPELLQNALQQMNFHLRHSVLHKPAFDLAQTFPKTYTNETEFRLKFLRSELFDAKKSAVRLVKFLELARELYGNQCLQRPVQLSDLGADGGEALRSGQWQLLPCRDRSGRRIFAMVNDMAFRFSLEARCKMAFYLYYCAMQDVESQQKGLIVVTWPGMTASSNFSLPDRREHILAMRIFESVPFRLVGAHFCLPNTPGGRFIRSVLTLGVGRNNRARIQFHSGERTEILYGLMGYGIPIELLPVTETGNVKCKNLQQWIKVRKALERPTSSADSALLKTSCQLIECPGLNDVVFRFGTSYLSHPGNVMFLGLIESKIDEHSSSSQEEKRDITWWVIEQVQNERKGRFLAWNGKTGSWSIVIDQMQIRNKVALCFRELRKKRMAHQNCQESQSSTFRFERQDGNKRKRVNAEDG